jgi:hypothetical protein
VKSSVNQGSNNEHTVQHCFAITWQINDWNTPTEYCGISNAKHNTPARPIPTARVSNTKSEKPRAKMRNLQNNFFGPKRIEIYFEMKHSQAGGAKLACHYGTYILQTILQRVQELGIHPLVPCSVRYKCHALHSPFPTYGRLKVGSHGKFQTNNKCPFFIAYDLPLRIDSLKVSSLQT